MADDAAGRSLLRPRSSIRTLLLTNGDVKAILVDEATASHHVLNPSASAVWGLLEQPASAEDLATDLAEIFGLEAAAARRAVDEAVGSFRAAGFLEDPHEPLVFSAPKSDEHSGRPLPREHDP